MRTAKGKAADLIKHFDGQIDDAIDRVIMARATYKQMRGGTSHATNLANAVDNLKELTDSSREARAVYGWFPVAMKEDVEDDG